MSRERKTAWILVPIKVQYWADNREVCSAFGIDLDEWTDILHLFEYSTKQDAKIILWQQWRFRRQILSLLKDTKNNIKSE